MAFNTSRICSCFFVCFFFVQMHFHIDKNLVFTTTLSTQWQEKLQRRRQPRHRHRHRPSHCHLVSLSTGIVTMLQLLQCDLPTAPLHSMSYIHLFPYSQSRLHPIRIHFARLPMLLPPRLNAHASNSNSLQMNPALRARKHFLITQMLAAQFASLPCLASGRVIEAIWASQRES